VIGTKIGARLRAERVRRNLSQADLEGRCGLPRCRISWLEKGHVVPTIETLEKLCGGLEMPLYQLFRDSELAEVSRAERIAAKGKVGSKRGGRSGILGELRQELRSLCEDDQDLLLYIARGLANRRKRNSLREGRRG
jgi:transcriptional regulator with XRE-family HTH domain